MKKYLPILLLFLAHSALRAQVIEQLSPQEKKQLTKVTEPLTLYKGFLRTGFSVNFGIIDKNFDEEGKKIYYNGNISGLTLTSILSMQYGITDRLEVEALLPHGQIKINSSYTYEIPYTGEFATEENTVKSNGLGDILVMTRYQIIRDKGNTAAATLGLGVNFPTGKSEVTDFKNAREYNGAIAKGEWGIFPEFKIRKIAYPFSFEFNAGLIKYFGAEKTLVPGEDPVEVISGNEIIIRPQMNFHLNEWVSFANYFDYYLAMKDDFEGEDPFGYHNNQFNQWTIRYYPGITLQVKKLRIEQSVLIPLAGKVVTADPAFYFTVQYMF